MEIYAAFQLAIHPVLDKHFIPVEAQKGQIELKSSSLPRKIVWDSVEAAGANTD